jgi:hypothetical protein
MCPLAAGGQEPRIQVYAALHSTLGLRGRSLPCLSQLLAAPGGHMSPCLFWPISAYLHVTLLSVSLVFPSAFLS